jgi:hypothetical protein
MADVLECGLWAVTQFMLARSDSLHLNSRCNEFVPSHDSPKYPFRFFVSADFRS